MVTYGWRKSSYSGQGSECVEVAATEHFVLVRDTQDRGAGPVLSFLPESWTTFLRTVRADGQKP